MITGKTKEMQGFKAATASLLRRSKVQRHHCHRRNLSSLPISKPIDDDLDNQVLIEGEAYSRTVILNRPSALNALNTNIGARLLKLYKSWEDDPDIGFVMMKGSGRAFCAGGDIVGLYNLINQGKLEECKEFFRTLYSFIYLLGTYLKPNKIRPNKTQVLVSILGDESKLSLASKLSNELRDAKIHKEYMTSTRFSNHIDRAKKSRIPWMVLVGDKELERGIVKLKNLEITVEEEVPMSDFVSELKKMLTIKHFYAMFMLFGISQGKL